MNGTVPNNVLGFNGTSACQLRAVHASVSLDSNNEGAKSADWLRRKYLKVPGHELNFCSPSELFLGTDDGSQRGVEEAMFKDSLSRPCATNRCPQ